VSAAADGDIETVTLLLEQEDVDVNVIDVTGRSALHAAAAADAPKAFI